MQEILVRRFMESDADALGRVYFDAVRFGTTEFYDEAQRQAWAPAPPTGDSWRERLKSQYTFVAEQQGIVIGFMTLRADGLIDFAFVAPDHIGQGVAKKLYAGLIQHAQAIGLQCLHTEASHLARRFFERQGWRVLKEQIVKKRGVAMTNFLMEKNLIGEVNEDSA